MDSRRQFNNTHFSENNDRDLGDFLNIHGICVWDVSAFGTKCVDE